MSWSFNAIGTPENLQQALDKEGEGYTGQSKQEFDAAKPHLQALIGMNVSLAYPAVLQVEASGHATTTDGKVTYSTCVVKITNLPGRLV